MRDELRHIALSVKEPRPGVFCWVMLEDAAGTGTWIVIERSYIDYSSYLGALGGGVFELDLMGIGSHGPRTGVQLSRSAHRVQDSLADAS